MVPRRDQGLMGAVRDPEGRVWLLGAESGMLG